MGAIFSCSLRAEWRPLSEATVSTSGTAFAVLEADGTVFNTRTGNAPGQNILTASWPGGDFHGIRLDVLTDSRLPANGPGWAPHGNFILSRITVSFLDPSGKTHALPLARAYTEHEQDGWTLASTIAELPDLTTGWGISGALGLDHIAYFASAPTAIPSGSILQISLRHGTEQFYDHQVGRFRITTTNDSQDLARYFASPLRKVPLDESPFDPFELSVAADGRVYYIERLGAVKRVEPAQRTSITVGQLEVFSQLDDGLIGFTLDPDFTTNGWLYLCYSAPGVSENRVSRFTLKDDQLDLTSEKILLRIPVQRDTPPCHTGGSLAFDAQGNLLISTGDNINPFDSEGYSPLDERPERAAWDARSSAGNTMDLRGKILRITPRPDGSYTIPEGNLFLPNDPLARPEIYVMGCRNPFRLSVDQQTGTLYWGEVGPDALAADPNRGPSGQDEINQARAAGNFGWPFFVADNQSYLKFNYASQTSAGPWDAANAVNHSPHNTGRRQLPPAQSALLWYGYAYTPATPLLGMGGRCAMAGPVYHYDPTLDSSRKLPAEFDRHLFFYDWMRGRILAARLDEQERPVEYRRILAGLPIRRPMDLELGPDGALYLIEWGTQYSGGNSDATISRIEVIPPGETDLDFLPEMAPIAPRIAPDDQPYIDALGVGDPKAGEVLIHDSSRVSCLNCHQIAQHGGVAGPNLDHVGQRLNPTEILESILHPERTVTPGYGLVMLTQEDGSVVAGVLAHEDKTQLKLHTPDQGHITIPLQDIAFRSELTSTMPTFAGVLSPQEAADLVAYLHSLAQPEAERR